jgi:hypothetical protein
MGFTEPPNYDVILADTWKPLLTFLSWSSTVVDGSPTQGLLNIKKVSDHLRLIRLKGSTHLRSATAGRSAHLRLEKYNRPACPRHVATVGLAHKSLATPGGMAHLRSATAGGSAFIRPVGEPAHLGPATIHGPAHLSPAGTKRVNRCTGLLCFLALR